MRAVLAAMVLFGCAPAAEIVVEVHTDFEPGIDFDEAVAAAGSESASDPARESGYFGAGVRLPPLRVPAGGARVTASLELDGARVVSRGFSVRAEGTVVVPVWLVRACIEVTCPEAGDPASFTECDGGRCVAPECVPTSDTCAPVACDVDGDCPAATDACAMPFCDRGNCTLVARSDVCGTAEWCDPDRGCRPRVGGADAGVGDTGCASGEVRCTDGVDDDCDGDVDCADADCAGQSCDDGDACTHGDACTSSACAGTSITCTSDACATRSCNGTSACTVTNAPDLTGCAADLNPCTNDVCLGGACVGVPRGDDEQYDGDGFHRCCGGVPVALGTEDHCAWCFDSCGGLGCGVVPFAGFSCNCNMMDSVCTTTTRGLCWDGGGADPLGWLCQCQNDGDCRAGQTCCMYGGPAFRHVCRWGGC